jgi:hypothetical protein
LIHHSFSGYGHIAPTTFWGKIFCICFAIVGIPLTLVVLSDIGEAIAKIVSVCEKKLNKVRSLIYTILPKLRINILIPGNVLIQAIMFATEGSYRQF